MTSHRIAIVEKFPCFEILLPVLKGWRGRYCVLPDGRYLPLFYSFFFSKPEKFAGPAHTLTPEWGAGHWMLRNTHLLIRYIVHVCHPISRWRHGVMSFGDITTGIDGRWRAGSVLVRRHFPDTQLGAVQIDKGWRHLRPPTSWGISGARIVLGRSCHVLYHLLVLRLSYLPCKLDDEEGCLNLYEYGIYMQSLQINDNMIQKKVNGEAP